MLPEANISSDCHLKDMGGGQLFIETIYTIFCNHDFGSVA